VENWLYPVEVIERVKIHYVRYGSDDGWRNANDVDLNEARFLISVPGFSLYEQLASKI